MTEAFDALEDRRVAGRAATGMTVVTTVLGAEHHTLTADSSSSVSPDPFLGLLGEKKPARPHDAVLLARALATMERRSAATVDAGGRPVVPAELLGPGVPGPTGAPLLYYEGCYRAFAP